VQCLRVSTRAAWCGWSLSPHRCTRWLATPRVIKTPHAQPWMFDDWCLVNLNVDAQGSTTANVRHLAAPTDSSAGWSVRPHSQMARPCYPLEGRAGRGPAETVHVTGGRGETAGQARVLGEDFAYTPTIEHY
jgi:hypothetical protein